MSSFASDNNSGVHPLLLDALIQANQGYAVGYGDDEYTYKAEKIIRAVFGEDVQPHFVFNGTGANVIALQGLTRSFQCIICASTAHIYGDECGAPTKFTSAVMKPIDTPDGKLTPELIQNELQGIGEQHHSQPKVVYLSQSTEMGTLYTQEELKDICNFSHANHLYVHMDGSRLANACAKTGLGMRELSRDCGVDILSLGGTKNGMMIGEAVIAFHPELNENIRFIRKQSAQLYSKMRYLSAQYIAYFEKGLWLENARNANEMATYLAERLQSFPEIQLTQKVEANALFLIMPKNAILKMLEKYFFYFWNESSNEIRLVCSWDTTKKDIDAFINHLKTVL
ncbi:MAG: low specificity L-threonine aldolase [Candidatus Symbiothrix sp.]|nr:low specificity L-threonine aldolase [Candidatus Symbiothrix sp.]